jgi:hypothetical protein
MTAIKTSKRPAPAYQEYASDILANRSYRAMSMAERGLWDTIRKECWVNGSVPSSVPVLAKYLGIDANHLRELLSPTLISWFNLTNEDITSPEIDAYRLKIELQRQGMSEGGRNGGRKSQENRRKKDQPTLEGRVKALSRDEKRREELNREEPSKEVINLQDHKAWIDDFDRTKSPSNNSYLKQSKGY